MSNTQKMKLDFSGAKLRGEHLDELDLSGADFSNADLIEVSFMDSNLHGANFKGAKLQESYIFGSILQEANFHGADLEFANISSSTNLMGANLSNASLIYTSFKDVYFAGANFTNATMASTTFSNVDLSRVKGLDTVVHNAPSSIGVDTLYRSRGNIPENTVCIYGSLNRSRSIFKDRKSTRLNSSHG